MAPWEGDGQEERERKEWEAQKWISMCSRLWQVPAEGGNGARSGKDWVSFESVLMEHVRRRERCGMKGNVDLWKGISESRVMGSQVSSALTGGGNDLNKNHLI